MFRRNAHGSHPNFLALGPSALVGALALAFATLPASADVIATFVVNGDGTVTYTYEVDNTAGAFDVALWSLEFPFATPDWDQLDTFSGGQVGVPGPSWYADAGIPVGGLSAQDFLALDPAGDILVGSLLGGFSFTSSRLPGPIAYFEFSAVGDSVSGTTLGPAFDPPSAIPEPSTWVAGSTLLALAALGTGWRRLRPTAAS
jgi:hypothetical protein